MGLSQLKSSDIRRRTESAGWAPSPLSLGLSNNTCQYSDLDLIWLRLTLKCAVAPTEHSMRPGRGSRIMAGRWGSLTFPTANPLWIASTDVSQCHPFYFHRPVWFFFVFLHLRSHSSILSSLLHIPLQGGGGIRVSPFGLGTVMAVLPRRPEARRGPPGSRF